MRLLARVLSLSLSLSAATMPVYVLAAEAPQLEHALHIHAADIGFLNSVSFISWSLSALTLGRRVDCSGGYSVLSQALMALAATTALLALTRSFAELFVVVAFCGFASGAIPSCAYRIMSDTVPEGRKGFAFGVVQAGFPAAAVVAGVAAPGLASQVGWRAGLVVCAAMALVALLITRCTLGSGIRSGNSLRNVEASNAGAGIAVRNPSQTLIPLILVASILANGATGALLTYLVLSLVRTGAADATAGAIFAIGGVITIAVRTLAGRLTDAMGIDPLRLTGALLIIGALSVLTMASSSLDTAACAAIVGMGVGWGWTGLLGLSVVQLFPQRSGVMSGRVLTVAGSVGAGLGPLAMGLAVEQVGYVSAERLLAGLFGASALLFAAIASMRDFGGRTAYEQ